MISVSMSLGNNIGDAHHLQDFARERVASQSVVGGSQVNFAGILSSGQIPGKTTVAIAIDKEDITTSHSGSNLHSVFWFKGLSHAKASASSKIASNHQGTKGINSTTAPHFADTIRANQDFSPKNNQGLID
jgi:hypothetical protein